MSTRIASIAFICVAVGFLAKQIVYLQEGDRPHFTDATSEAFVWGGARGFFYEGGKQNAFLPQYKGFRTETPVRKIQETGVYTHFLPGPDYFLAAHLFVFGDSNATLAKARVFPMLFLLFAILLFAWTCEKRLFPDWKWGKFWIAGWICLVPGVYRWAVSLFGHPFSTAFVLIGLSLGLWIGKTRLKPWQVASAFGAGFFANLFLLEGAFATAISPLVGYCLSREEGRLREALILAGSVGLGLLTVYAIHFLQVKVFLGSWELAWLDQIGTALTRAEHREGPNRLQLIGQFSRHAGGHFRLSALSMLILGSFFVWLMPYQRTLKTKMILGMFAAAIAGYLFPLLLLHHSIIHSFRVPRQFGVLFFAFVVITVTLAYQRISARRGLS